MSCSTSTSPITFDIQYFLNNQCFECANSGCSSTVNSKCVYYAGPNLSCSGIETNDSIELSLQKIDEQICSVIGDYSNYQFNCLTAWWGGSITEESEFVDAITAYACEIVTTLEQFTGTTFPAFEEEINDRVDTLASPEITCTAAGVTSSDDLFTILEKYCAKFGDIDDELDISGVVWNNCLTVFTPPTNVAEAFELVQSQICQVLAASGGSLPTFNNTGSCLPDPGSSDSLEDTVDKIKTRLCEVPTWDASNITWGCVTTPSVDTDLEEAIQNIVDPITTLLEAMPTFDTGDFVVTATDSGDPCAGVTISLATPIDVDRYVASNSGDTSPGTLADKLVAGTNLTLDYTTSPGQVIVNATSGTGDNKVKADTTDTTAGYLDEKLNGASGNNISILATYNAGTEQVDLTPSIDEEGLLDALLDLLQPGTNLYIKFCEKVAGCPSPCDPPQNVQAVAANTTTTTTSTTTIP